MNYETAMARIDDALRTVESVKAKVKEASENTANFLKACEGLGVDLIAVNVKSDQIKACADWSFGFDGSIFADGKDANGTPITWRAIRAAGMEMGCGNGGQAQIFIPMIDGVYQRKNGAWVRS